MDDEIVMTVMIDATRGTYAWVVSTCLISCVRLLVPPNSENACYSASVANTGSFLCAFKMCPGERRPYLATLSTTHCASPSNKLGQNTTLSVEGKQGSTIRRL